MDTIVDRSLNRAVNYTLYATGAALGAAVTLVAARVIVNIFNSNIPMLITFYALPLTVFLINPPSTDFILFGSCTIAAAIPTAGLFEKFIPDTKDDLIFVEIFGDWFYLGPSALAFGDLFTKKVKHELTYAVRKIAPQRVKLTLGVVGAALTTAVASFVLRIFKGSYAPWGRKGLLIQTVIAIAAGLLYTRLDRLLTCEELMTNDPTLLGSVVGKILSTNTKSGSYEEHQLQIRSNVEFVLEHVGDRKISNEFKDALAQTMIFQNSFFKVNFKKPKENYDMPLAILPQVMIQYISQWLLPNDIARLGRTCQTLYILIYGPKGAPIWSSKNVGSIGSVQYFYLLAAEIAAAQDKTKALFLQFTLSKWVPKTLLFPPAWRNLDNIDFLGGVVHRWKKHRFIAEKDLKFLQLHQGHLILSIPADLRQIILNYTK